ncbi:FAS1-like dehydratase domain-containing protein [Alloalcanivorax xenomutans]|uniref:MaoC family dehydratase N-terminal domain-containing protein n=1 Tax=Alloalcanivorax xenomutans TaxID=1094342 RepID=A0A9Q3W982_9GAMM|nr:MaoC family dehydratase N-terminal domain-containing protein [Alloalcanivorax xenomutans]MCE7510874.1 MaoC family dehydratase N-terminal domain-containing protein [Alloalcanivorax xenomutans]
MALDNANKWLGKEQIQDDSLDLHALARVTATLGGAPLSTGDALPHLWQWAFFQPVSGMDTLGPDGHPLPGDFLPPIRDCQRMWAGGEVRFNSPLRAGVPARRHSRIEDIKEKHGRSGSLTFITVRHRYLQDDEEKVSERQDIVYREPVPLKASIGEPMPELQWADTIKPEATLLFRYSAVTFNSHRIHYDWPYTTGEEGYPGLVVHGPLIATLVMRAFDQANPDKIAKVFRYRGIRPLIAPEPFQVGGVIESPGVARVMAGNEQGQAHVGEVEFEETR